MDTKAILRIAGDDADLAAAISEFVGAEQVIHRQLRDLDEMLGEVRRTMAVGDPNAGRFENAGTPLTTLALWLGRREVLLGVLTRAKVDLAEVRRAARR